MSSRRNSRHMARKRQRLIVEQDGLCATCERPFGVDERAPTLDHIVRLCDGGTNENENLQALCLGCHRRKDGWGRVPPGPAEMSYWNVMLERYLDEAPEPS